MPVNELGTYAFTLDYVYKKIWQSGLLRSNATPTRGCIVDLNETVASSFDKLQR